MEEEINDGKFIEFGEYKGNLYGTSAETVKSLVNSGFFCVLTPHYQVRGRNLLIIVEMKFVELRSYNEI